MRKIIAGVCTFFLCAIALLSSCSKAPTEAPLENDEPALIAGMGGNWLVIEDGNLTAWGEDYGKTPDTEERYWSDYSDREIIFENAASVWGSRFTALVLDNEGRLWTSGDSGHENPETNGDWDLVLEDVVTASHSLWNGVAVCSDGSLWVWGRNDGSVLYNGAIDNGGSFYPPLRIMEGVRFVRDGKYVVTQDGKLYGLYLFDGQGASPLPLESWLLESGVKDVAGDQILTEDGDLCVFTSTQEPDWFSWGITALGISNVDKVFVGGYRTMEGNFYLWDYTSGKPLTESPAFLIEEKIVGCARNLDGFLLRTEDGRLLQADITLGELSIETINP